MEGHVDSNLRNVEINDVKILASKFVKRIIKRCSNQKKNIHICGESCNEKQKNSYLKKEDNQKSLKTSKEKSVNAKERGIKPFIPHPLSLGFNYRQVRTAFYYNNEKKDMEKRNAMKPLSSFKLPKKPFFPNFIDPVPENIPSTFGICQNETQSKILLSSDPSVTSNSHQSHEVKYNKTKKNEAENINVSNNKEELSLNILLLLFFRNTCPVMLLSNRKCNDEKCLHSHKLPSIDEVELQLLRKNFNETLECYHQVLEFPILTRKMYLPAFSRVFVKRNQLDLLKNLINDIQKLPPPFGFLDIIDSMTRYGWDRKKSINFLMDNLNKHSRNSNIEMLEVIGHSGKEILNYKDFIINFSENKE